MIPPVQAAWARHVYHIYAIRVKNRDEVMRRLAEKGVGSGVHYPVPVHLQEAYRSLGYQPGAFPIAERCATEFVSLPMYPELTSGQIEIVVEAVKEALAGGTDLDEKRNFAGGHGKERPPRRRKDFLRRNSNKNRLHPGSIFTKSCSFFSATNGK